MWKTSSFFSMKISILFLKQKCASHFVLKPQVKIFIFQLEDYGYLLIRQSYFYHRWWPLSIGHPFLFLRRSSDFLIGNHIFKSIKLFLCVSYCTSDFRSMWKMLLFYLMQCYALIISSIIFAAEIHIPSIKRNQKNIDISFIHSINGGSLEITFTIALRLKQLFFQSMCTAD